MQTATRLLVILFQFLVVLLLTVLTQIGGVIYLFCFPLYRKIKNRFTNRFIRFLLQAGTFLAIYLSIVLLVIPLLAPLGGRVAMPVRSRSIKPCNWITIFFCRNYVRPALRDLAEEVAADMSRQFPGTVLLYLDAQHPFFNGWRLYPHLSHSDGRKLDIALLWKDPMTGSALSGTPSSIGYGVFEDPRSNEYNRAADCAAQGYWQYGYLSTLVSQKRKPNFQLDEKRTAAMTRLFCQHRFVKRVLIEPYLKKRLLLEDLNNLRHPGCNAVRHDDHIHVELGNY